MIPKFRAWSLLKKKMYSVEEIDFKLKDCWVSNYNECHSINLESCILMQSTGVKDIEGNEIFEGDIVKYDGVNTFFKVVYERGAWCLVVVTDHIDDYIPYDELTGTGEEWYGCQCDLIVPLFELAWNECDDFKVIGNIYENPELLEVK